jgi:hypothetical protein
MIQNNNEGTIAICNTVKQHNIEQKKEDTSDSMHCDSIYVSKTDLQLSQVRLEKKEGVKTELLGYWSCMPILKIERS